MEPEIFSQKKNSCLLFCKARLNALKNMAEHDRLFKDAEEWIFEDDHEWPFSFINICEAVDLDPKYLRKGLLHWRQSAIPEANTLWPAIVFNKGSNKRCA